MEYSAAGPSALAHSEVERSGTAEPLAGTSVVAAGKPAGRRLPDHNLALLVESVVRRQVVQTFREQAVPDNSAVGRQERQRIAATVVVLSVVDSSEFPGTSDGLAVPRAAVEICLEPASAAASTASGRFALRAVSEAGPSSQGTRVKLLRSVTRPVVQWLVDSKAS